MITIVSTSQFPLGQIVATPNALRTLTAQEIRHGLERHIRADWGDVPPEDAERNTEALHEGSQIFSVYGEGKRRFWIITAVDRSATTILLPEDY